VTAHIDPSQFRSVLGHAPTSVVVVTGCDSSGHPVGITIGSFVSVSLDPPLVGFLPGLSSRSWQAIRESGRFCVNVLSASQEELCWKFAKEGDDKFAGVAHTTSALGNPVLADCIATIDCTIEAEHEAGDHWFVVGRVDSMSHIDNAHDAMVFFRGKVVAANYPNT
jgi:flavin reductase (DIM6/NTAB) family NADH-FMN oxidoreductase RutF